MLKKFLNLIDWLLEPALDGAEADPLMHPALQAMDARELADLPLSDTTIPKGCCA